tara:strand:+ start:2564 stop:2887 length:324 start_codon:yes stop_codon:yes gene_type:complete
MKTSELKNIIKEELSKLSKLKEQSHLISEEKKNCECDSTHLVTNCSKTCTYCCAICYPDIEFNDKIAAPDSGGEGIDVIDFKTKGKVTPTGDTTTGEKTKDTVAQKR